YEYVEDTDIEHHGKERKAGDIDLGDKGEAAEAEECDESESNEGGSDSSCEQTEAEEDDEAADDENIGELYCISGIYI
ncbi:hypothetical protein FRC06_004557, partial [Ceratobasidium sp. 370]